MIRQQRTAESVSLLLKVNERENEKSEGSFFTWIEGNYQSYSLSWFSRYYSLTCYQSISEAGQIVVTFLEGTEVNL